MTGTLRTHVDGLGGTEIQFMGMFMLICPVIDIYGIHELKLPFTSMSIMDAFLYLTIVLYYK